MTESSFLSEVALALCVRMHVHKHLPLISVVISTASLNLITTGLSLTANDGKETLMSATRFRRTLVSQLKEAVTLVWVNSSVVTKQVQKVLSVFCCQDVRYWFHDNCTNTANI